MRRLPVLLAVVIGATSGVYTLVYLYRWQWNRAAIAGTFLVATELIIVTSLVLARLRRIEDRLDAISRPTADRSEPNRGGDIAATALAANPPPVHDHFAWLRDSTRSPNVFLPVLLGAGAVASAFAWVVEHVARVATTSVVDRRLATRLAPMMLPAGGLLAPSREAAPVGRRRVVRARRIAAIGVLLAAAAVSAAALDYVADRIQTRPDETVDGVETVLDLQLRGAVALAQPERIFAHLWSTCTGPDVFEERLVPIPVVTHGPGGAVQAVVPDDLGRHGLDRLVGCLNDTTLDKVQADVMAVHTRPTPTEGVDS